MLEQSEAKVVVYCRTEQGFECEVHRGRKACIPLQEIGIELPLAEVYDDVEFVPEPDSDEIVG